MKTIFLDRDGVINKEKNYLYKKNDFEFIDGIFEACYHFSNLGFKIIVITNQSGIGRGYYSPKDFEILTTWMLEKFMEKHIDILDVFYCPHVPEDKCRCRKPSPGMFLKAKKKYNIDMKKSWMIGDKENDIVAANSSGISQTILVRTGHEINAKNSSASYILKSINKAIKIITG